MATSHYDDSNLRKLFRELEPKQRKEAFKKAFRKGANRVKKVALSNLRSSGLNHVAALSKGIRAIVFKRDAGFRVTAASRQANKQGKGERGMHLNRQGLKKPVLPWAETGTAYRRVKRAGKRVKIGNKWVTTGVRRGMMKRYGFIAKTMGQVESSVTEDLRTDMTESIHTIAKKYGGR